LIATTQYYPKGRQNIL